ncbi:MAG: LuxR C-terminal-related transcriptional regulator [Pseudomonadota bacterium]
MQRVRTPDGRYRYGYVGAGVKDLFNLDPQDLMARTEVDHAWIHPEDRSRFVAALETSARDLTPLDEEVRVESPTGDYRWVRSIGHPRLVTDGSIIWDGVALDIHDRRSALETLSTMLTSMRDSEASEDRFSAIAAQDVNDRLDELRGTILEFAPIAAQSNPALFERLSDRLEALAQAVGAANELAETVVKTGTRSPKNADGGSGLTSRQLQIMRLAASGASNREIGKQLALSEGTVKQHMSRIFKKLGVQNRAEAVARILAELGAPPQPHAP